MKKIILFLFRIFLFAFIFFLLNAFMDFRTSFEAVDIYLGYPFLCLISLIYGPAYGAFSGILGVFFASAADGYISWSFCAMMGLNIAAVGVLCRKLDIKNGFFGKREAARFISTLFLVNFGSWLIGGVASRYLEKSRLNLAAVPLAIPLTYSISGMLVGTLLIALYARSRLSALNFYRS